LILQWRSDSSDGDIGKVCGERSQIVWIVCEDHAAAKPHSCGHDKGVDGYFASRVGSGQ